MNIGNLQRNYCRELIMFWELEYLNRKLAKQISNEDINAYLKEASDDSFEEIMLQGLVIRRDIRTYYVRFAVVMSLKYFVDQEHINLVFSELDKIKCKGYYSQMAVAWAVSCYFIKFREETFNCLRNNCSFIKHMYCKPTIDF